MAITITDDQIKRWIEDGIQGALTSMLKDRYGTGAQIKTVVETAIKKAEPKIVKVIDAGLAKVFASPEFNAKLENDISIALRKEISDTLASQYRGAFTGVIRAAAKASAHNEIIAQRVVELTQAGITKSVTTAHGEL